MCKLECVEMNIELIGRIPQNGRVISVPFLFSIDGLLEIIRIFIQYI